MNRILLDTNVILDIALNRKPFVQKSGELLLYLEKNRIPAYISATTVTDIYFIAQRKTSHNKAIGFLKNLFDFIGIAGVDSISILNALNSNMKDFEDAVQSETAKQNSIKIIITRNQDDFKNSGLEIYSPKEFLDITISK